MRFTGMRPGEVLAMTAAEIDWTDTTCWVYRPGHHKTEHKDKARSVMMGPGSRDRAARTEGRNRRPAFPDDARGLPASDRPRLRSGVSSSDHFQNHRQEADRCPESRIAGLGKAHQWHPNQIRHTVRYRGPVEVRARGGAMPLGHSQRRCDPDLCRTGHEESRGRCAENRVNRWYSDAYGTWGVSP